jgi:ABC-type lipoprotein release transport system permease subunit
MTLTFLNLVVVSGILVGLIQGAVDAVKVEYTSDIFISTLKGENYIENSPDVISILDKDSRIEAFSPRYLQSARLEADYKLQHEDKENKNAISASVAGINPIAEDNVSGISDILIEGSYLEPGDYDQVLLGSYLTKQYFPIESSVFNTLDNVSAGTKIRMTINGNVREVIVKGITKSKVDETNMRVYMNDTQLRTLIGRDDYNVNEIAIKLKPGINPDNFRDSLVAQGIGQVARVQTFVDAEPKFIKDMITTFSILGNIFSSLGLIVAAITIFIVIFINAITRRKFIGILKGIGISGRAIELSYIFQSVFYAIIGSALGLAIVYGGLVPYLDAHPINFPFSDGILVAPIMSSLLRLSLLVVSTIIAGYLPARMIVRKNTLDSILGRN